MAHVPDSEEAVVHTCESGVGCSDTRPGHNLSAVQLQLAAAAPSHWRDAVVVSAREDGWVEAVTIEGASVSLWNHRDLADTVAPGDPVALHADHNVLAAGQRRFNVLTHVGRALASPERPPSSDPSGR